MLPKAATGAAITMCLALLIQARRREQNALAMRVQKRESKDMATIAELRECLSTLEARLRSTSAENHTLTEEIQGLKARSLPMQESTNTLPEDLSSARERETQLNATITELQAARAEDETAIAGLQQHLSTLEARLLSTNAQSHTLTEENQAYKADSLSMRESIDTLSADLSSASDEVAQHNATITSLKKARDEDVTEIAYLLQQVSTLETRVLSTSAENRTLAEENKKYDANSLSMQESIDTLSENLSSAREEVAQHNSTITDLEEAQAEDGTTIADLRQQLSTLNALLLSANDENPSIDTLSEDLSSAREEAAQHNSTITELEEAQAADQTAITDLRQQLSTSEARIFITSAENRVLAEENKRHEADSLSMKESIDTLSEDLSSAREEVAQQNLTITDLEEARAEDQTAITDLRQQVSTFKARLLSATVDNYLTLEEESKRYEADTLSMQESIDTLSEDLASARKELAQRNSTITELEEVLDEDETTIADLRQQHKADSLSMQESINTLSRDLSSAREEVAQHNAKNTRLKAAQAKSESTIDKLRDQLAELSTENSSMSARNAEENVTRFNDLHQRLEQATKSAAYWHDLCMGPNLSTSHKHTKRGGDKRNRNPTLLDPSQEK